MGDVVAEWDWTAIGTLIVALATVGLAWQTRATVHEIRADREERRQAFVVAYAEVRGPDIAIIVENRGPGPALEVRVSVVDPGSWLESGSRAGVTFPLAIGYLPGGAKLPRTFDLWHQGMTGASFPATRVRTCWLDERGREHSSESIVDPAPWLTWRPKDPLEAIADTLDSLGRRL